VSMKRLQRAAQVLAMILGASVAIVVVVVRINPWQAPDDELIARYSSHKLEIEQLSKMSGDDLGSDDGFCQKGPGRRHAEEVLSPARLQKYLELFESTNVKCVFRHAGGIGTRAALDCWSQFKESTQTAVEKDT
jgi:hypothetical protein